jgi:stringent starvation protein B
MTENIPMTTNQPYLLKAFYDWIVNNDLTPYVVVNANYPAVEVPQQFVKDGQIVLNTSPTACVHFNLDYESLSFQARFGGQPFHIYIPSAAVLAIYARENGAGTMFEPEVAYDEEMTGLINDDEDITSSKGETMMLVIDGNKPDREEDDDPDNDLPPRGSRPVLRVVK